MMKNDAKKQREFFEKRKMQQKLKNMGISLPASPRSADSGSLDLVTLFVVNQIAAKKENKDPPKVAVLSSCKGRSKHKRNEPVVLPMSPCSPSQLSLVESQPQYSVQGTRERKHVIPQWSKCQQLSPVLESTFSDNGASDYLPPIPDLLSPFSSTSSASSRQGIFPLQLNLQQRSQTQTQTQPPPHCSPPPWDTSGLEETKPRVMSWSCGSNLAFYQPEKPTAAQILFGNPEPDEARDSARHEVPFSLNQAGDKEPSLDFTLNQAESEQQFEEDVFRGFSNEEYDRDACFEHNNGSMNGCESSPSYSCRGCYLSSDSNDDEEYGQQMDQTCYADIINSNLSSQGNLTQSHSNPRPPTPNIKPQNNTGDYQKVMENDKALRSKGAAQFVSHLLDQTPSSQQCKCKKIPNQMRDAGTQTVDISTAETCNASTQCCLVLDSASNLYRAPVDVSVQRSATGRQTGCTDAAAESNTHKTSTANPSSGGKHLAWSKRKFTTDNGEGKVVLQRPINPFVDVWSVTDGRGKPDGDGRDEREQLENCPLMKDHSDDMREEVTSATRVNRLAEEPETLEEIADILLLLKQRKEEG
ncbi:hypothetical protein PAMA_013109 [Pampus argenteus]